MQDPVCGLRRILFPRTRVNKGKKKGWSPRGVALDVTQPQGGMLAKRRIEAVGLRG
jgi:hypothetical protein